MAFELARGGLIGRSGDILFNHEGPVAHHDGVHPHGGAHPSPQHIFHQGIIHELVILLLGFPDQGLAQGVGIVEFGRGCQTEHFRQIRQLVVPGHLTDLGYAPGYRAGLIETETIRFAKTLQV